MARKTVRFEDEVAPYRPASTIRYHTKSRHSVGGADSYSSHTAPPLDFLLCLEFTTVLRSRHMCHPTTTSLMGDLASKLSRAGVAVRIHTPSSRAAEDHRTWTLSPDLTVPVSSLDVGQFAIKLTSPLFPFPSAGGFLSSLSPVFCQLQFDFKPTLSPECASHIHLVPARGRWTLEEATRLACAAVHFEPVLDALVPPCRRRSVWAKSNRHNAYLGRRRTVPECIAALRQHANSFPALAARMNWCGARSATGAAVARADDFVHAGYRWDLSGLDTAGAGTVVFRQPPGVLDARGAVGWVVLTACFAQVACGGGFESVVDAVAPPSLSSLSRGVRRQARAAVVARHHVEYLRDMFAQADAVVEAPCERARLVRDAEALSADEVARLRWEDMLQWSVGQEKFWAYVSHAGKGKRGSKLVCEV